MKFDLRTVRSALNIAERAYREYKKFTSSSSTAPKNPSQQSSTQRPSDNFASRIGNNYPGDYKGKVNFEYSPHLDGDADPGEVVWTWVPYEEDYSQGKDRPVIIIGRDGEYLLALMMTSKDKNNATHHNSDYLDIGTGSWDKEGRASEVKLNRVIRVRAKDMRREGAVIDRETFSAIKQAMSH